MFSEGHNNGIVEGIPIDRTRQNIVDILPYFKAFLVVFEKGRISTIFRLVRSIGMPSTIPLLSA